MDKKYSTLVAYTPGEQPQDKKYVKLNTNESPYPPSPETIGVLTLQAGESLRLYPDPDGKILTKKLADLYGVASENVFLANGSDDILNFAFMAYCANGRKVYFPDISYGFYSVFAELHGSDYTEIPLCEDFSVDYKNYCNLDGAVFIANPNAPTGLALNLSEIEEIVKSNPENVVIIDEAYVDFGAESAVSLLKKYNNLLVCMTFSKSRSMAGARLGFALGSKDIIEDLHKLRYSTNPYNINRLTLLLGAAAIDSQNYYTENCKKIIATRQWTVNRLTEMGFQVLPSKANFIFAKHFAVSGEKIYLDLKEKGVLVRHFTKDRIKDFNRITIGTPEEMEILVEKIKEITEAV